MKAREQDGVEQTLLWYENSDAHIQDELQKLDLLLQLRALKFRQKIQDMPEAARLRHLSIADDEVDWLLRPKKAATTAHPDLSALFDDIRDVQRAVDSRISAALEAGVHLALPRLGGLFGLTSEEMLLVVLCLAPEMDRKYDRIFAYLQDDMTRKRPSVDLALDMLCDSGLDRTRGRGLLGPRASLVRYGILQAVPDPHSLSGSSDLARLLKLDPRIVNYLLSNDSFDESLQGAVALAASAGEVRKKRADQSVASDLVLRIKAHFASPLARRNLIVHLHGPAGAGKRSTVIETCRHLGCPLLVVDMDMLPPQDKEAGSVMRAAFREGVLLQAPLYLADADAVLGNDDASRRFLKKLDALMTEFGPFVFLSGEQALMQRQGLANSVIHSLRMPVPDVAARKALWEELLKTHLPGADSAWAGRLAAQFRMTPGRMQSAVELLTSRQGRQEVAGGVTIEDLHDACRDQAVNALPELAVRIEPRYAWEDLVLPQTKIEQLREICSHSKHQYRVFSEWGFGRKLSHGTGLSVLFSGPPGTGKTMAAAVMARELGLELVRIELSGVVSKYIGETEKNLNKIFKEAGAGDAILFFDEADALFGKRTRVSDAHDRYANIETGYLLQKMEEYEGTVILATNLRENMDEAFARRIRFIVEFPFPDEASRRGIWKAHFPSTAPIDAGVDYDLLARRFRIAGGNIKNIALSAAFLAAENGGVVTMEHVLHACRREYEKTGKIWDERCLSGPAHSAAEGRSVVRGRASDF